MEFVKNIKGEVGMVDCGETYESLRDAEFDSLREALSGGCAERAMALRALAVQPTSDRRIIPILEQLLNVREVCVVSTPYLYGEVRYLAGLALRAEYDLLDLECDIELRDVVDPIDYNQIIDMAAEASIVEFPPSSKALDMLAKLRDLGMLPTSDLRL